jgi:cytochrome c
MSAHRSARLFILAAALATSTAFAAAPKPDIENGKTIFSQRCGICHAVNNEPGGPMVGPNMVGLVGRKSASVAGFAMYSPALKKYGVTWSAKTLDEFLVSPMTKVPGTTMPMMLPDNKERTDVIGYLATLKAGK